MAEVETSATIVGRQFLFPVRLERGRQSFYTDEEYAKVDNVKNDGQLSLEIHSNAYGSISDSAGLC